MYIASMRPLPCTALLLVSALVPRALPAQWQMQDAHTTADLRGIDNVGGGVAWASGTNGTILRTEDAGFVWQLCAIPPGAEHLDFRGVQAFDNNTALVMSSGKGDLSRVYKTTDGCQTWKLVFTNPDAPDGFFDQLLMVDPQHGLLLGDPAPSTERNPVAGPPEAPRIRVTDDGGNRWAPVTSPSSTSPRPPASPFQRQGLFAASNSSAAVQDRQLWIGTTSAFVLRRQLGTPTTFGNAFTSTRCAGRTDPFSGVCGVPWTDWVRTKAPLAEDGPAAGIFSVHFSSATGGIAVGGNYQTPQNSQGTAAYTHDGAATWHAPQTPPHGYRSAVAYDAKRKTWMTVGPNGTDISTDDGHNWRPLKPDPAAGDAPDADQHWNALSLPYVVGPHGRIATLRPNALNKAQP